MEVKFLDKNEYDKWNDFVDESPQGYIWDYSWWLEITTYNDFEICVIIDDDKIIVAGIALPYYSTGNIKTPPLTRNLGLLFGDMSKQNNMRLQKQLIKQKEYTNVIFDFIQPHMKQFYQDFHYSYNYWSPLYWRSFHQMTRYSFIIDYQNYNPKEEFKRFSKGHKWILNKVEKKSDLKVLEGTVEEYEVEAVKTYERQGLKYPVKPSFFKQLCTELLSRGMLKIFKIVDTHGCIHGIECHLYNIKSSFYWLGASDEKFRDSGGHTYLTWFSIQYFSDKCRSFDFGGSMLESVERNFKNFSAIPTPFYQLRYDNNIFRYYSRRLLRDISKNAINNRSNTLCNIIMEFKKIRNDCKSTTRRR